MAFLQTRADFDLSQNQETAPVAITEFQTFSIQFDWSGIDGTDGEAEVQGSVDGTKWNKIKSDDNLLILDTATDTQIWEVLDVTTRYVRLAYRANSNTTGTGLVQFFGGVSTSSS